MEELQHLAQENVSMDIDTFTNLNPRVLQVGPGLPCWGAGGWPSQARAALGHGSRAPSTPNSEVCRQCGPQVTSPGWL